MEKTNETTILDQIDFGDNLLDASLINNKISPKSPLLAGEEKKPKNNQTINDFQIENITSPIYEVNCLYNSYDCFFDIVNYQANNKVKESKEIRTLPKHIRNTLFLRSDRIKRIKKLDFSQIFMVCEEIKEIANNFYKNKNYFCALERYNLLYSLFKWIEIKDKNKEKAIFSNINLIRACPIIDDDIVYKTIKFNRKDKNELNNFNHSLCYTLKAMSYCYFNLRLFTQAIKCLDEAIEYSQDSLEEVYFRRAQARMFNKYSTVDELVLALKDLNMVETNQEDNQLRVNSHITMVNSFIKQKKVERITKIKSILLIMFYFRFVT